MIEGLINRVTLQFPSKRLPPSPTHEANEALISRVILLFCSKLTAFSQHKVSEALVHRLHCGSPTKKTTPYDSQSEALIYRGISQFFWQTDSLLQHKVSQAPVDR